MSEQDQQIKAEMRLMAIEYLLCKVYAAMVVPTLLPNINEAAVKQKMAEFIDGARKQIFPGLDPALSDHASAEFEDALAVLMRSVESFLLQALAKRA